MDDTTTPLYARHIYMDLFGSDEVFAPLYKCLDELKARKLEGYPLWIFHSQGSADSNFRLLAGAVSKIAVVDEGRGLIEPRWRVLLMHESGHNGFSRGFTPEQYEQLFGADE